MKQKLPRKQITRVVLLHCIADCIESYAVDLKMNDLVQKARNIRVEADRYGDPFSDLAELFIERVKGLNYNKRDTLVALSSVLCEQARKVRIDFISVNPRSEYIQLPMAIEIRNLFNGDFCSPVLTKKINDIIIDMRTNNFVD